MSLEKEASDYLRDVFAGVSIPFGTRDYIAQAYIAGARSREACVKELEALVEYLERDCATSDEALESAKQENARLRKTLKEINDIAVDTKHFSRDSTLAAGALRELDGEKKCVCKIQGTGEVVCPHGTTLKGTAAERN